MRALGVVALCALASCVGSRRVAGVELGETITPGDARFAPREGDRAALRQPPSFEGQPARSVTAWLDERGAVASIEIVVAVEAAGVEALEGWVRGFCKSIGGEPEELTPSPLGTPEPGKDWNPVITTNVTCRGRYRGHGATVRYSHARARDFDRAHVAVTVRAASAGGAAEAD